MEPHELRSRSNAHRKTATGRTWLLLGMAFLIAAACVCIAGVSMVWFLANQATSEPSVRVEMDPPTLTTSLGDNVTFTLRLYNQSTDPVYLQEIAFPSKWQEYFSLLETQPPYANISEFLDMVYLEFPDVVIEPEQSLDVHITVKALREGNASWEWDIVTNVETVTVRMASKITPQTALQSTPTEPVTLAPTGSPSPTSSPVPVESDLGALTEKLARAVVMVVVFKTKPELQPVGWGSGTLISPDGYILTNAHVVIRQDTRRPWDIIGILMTEKTDEPPVPKFLARVIKYDLKLDIAILKIHRDFDGKPVTGNLHLPWIPLGDSDKLRLGDPLIILGYPGVGGNTITLTRGEVSGFVSQPGYGSRAWIKTSATIAGGSSGGLAADLQGRLVGIPTLAGVAEGTIVDCRPVVDTNNDGVIDQRDTCVPVGGYLNALRPVNLAKPLIAQVVPLPQVADAFTPSPEPTSPPSSTMAAQHPIQWVFTETFDNPTRSYWVEESYEEFQTRYTNGGFQITVKMPQSIVSFLYLETTFQRASLVLRYQIHRTAGDGDVGLLCHVSQDESHYYALSVSEDGYYSIWMAQDDQIQALTPWTQLPFPWKLSPTSSMTLEGTCGPRVLALLVNNRLIHQVHLPRPAQPGYAGFYVGTWERAPLTVKVDEFRLGVPAK